jgi:hypothetical protein
MRLAINSHQVILCVPHLQNSPAGFRKSPHVLDQVFNLVNLITRLVVNCSMPPSVSIRSVSCESIVRTEVTNLAGEVL